MKFVSRSGFIFGTILLLSISQINGSHVRSRRQASGGGKSELDWETILDEVSKIPIIGGGLHKALVNYATMVDRLNQLTNGALSRIAGGYLPCTIDLNGITCTGKPKNGGIIGITKELVNSTMLPPMVKVMTIDFLNAAVFPSFDAIFGVPVQKKGNM